MAPVNEDVKILQQAKLAAGKLTGAVNQLAERHATLVSERSRIDFEPRALDEVIASANELVDKQRAGGDREHSRRLATFLSGRLDQSAADQTKTVRRRPAFPDFFINEGTGQQGLSFEHLCWLAPDLVKARVSEILRSSGITFGLPKVERERRLAAIDLEIAEVERQHTELVDAAADVGIALPLLRTVQDRREADALAREREAELARQRAAVAAGR